MLLIGKVTFADNAKSYMWIAVGVLIGVLLPVLSSYVKNHFKAGSIDFTPYLLLLLFSLLLGLLILAGLRSQDPDKVITWFTALLAGYGGEATLEKLLTPGN